ncbi:LysR substrate-binding domain-containing protein, partial [Rhizobium ruizarguesonis]
KRRLHLEVCAGQRKPLRPAIPGTIENIRFVAFSSFWLLPRLAEFRRANPGILVRVISQDRQIALDDGEVDVAIRYGVPPFSDGTVIASRGD